MINAHVAAVERPRTVGIFDSRHHHGRAISFLNIRYVIRGRSIITESAYENWGAGGIYWRSWRNYGISSKGYFPCIEIGKPCISSFHGITPIKHVSVIAFMERRIFPIVSQLNIGTEILGSNQGAQIGKGTPHPGTFIQNKILPGIGELYPKNNERQTGKQRENAGKNGGKPFWRTPLFGWVLIGFSTLMSIVAFWWIMMWGGIWIIPGFILFCGSVVLATHGLFLTLPPS